jgi:hypothetical protein
VLAALLRRATSAEVIHYIVHSVALLAQADTDDLFPLFGEILVYLLYKTREQPLVRLELLTALYLISKSDTDKGKLIEMDIGNHLEFGPDSDANMIRGNIEVIRHVIHNSYSAEYFL